MHSMLGHMRQSSAGSGQTIHTFSPESFPAIFTFCSWIVSGISLESNFVKVLHMIVIFFMINNDSRTPCPETIENCFMWLSMTQTNAKNALKMPCIVDDCLMLWSLLVDCSMGCWKIPSVFPMPWHHPSLQAFFKIHSVRHRKCFTLARNGFKWWGH